MIEQLSQLVQQFGQEAVVNNAAVPNEQNQAVMEEAEKSIFSSLQGLASADGLEKLAELLQWNKSQDASNPAVQQMTQQLRGSLGEKFGLSSEVASAVAGGLIPKILGGLVDKVNDPNDSFQISDLIAAISGGGAQSGGIMDAISKYGGQFGLDQNADGKVDISDAASLANNKGGLGGLLSKLFGK